MTTARNSCRRQALRLITFTNQTMGSITRMRESWVRGVDIDPGPIHHGAGAGTLAQDWDDDDIGLPNAEDQRARSAPLDPLVGQVPEDQSHD